MADLSNTTFALVQRTPKALTRDWSGWQRGLGLAYAILAFVGTWVFFTWLVVFLGNLPERSDPWLDPSVDFGAVRDSVFAVIANLGLIGIFCLQHSLMARPAFKRWLATLIPGALERATYVHVANIAGFLMLYFWTPIPTLLWDVENRVGETAIWMAFGAGWITLFIGALSIDLFELLGLKQAWAWYRGRNHQPLTLKTSWLYRYLEHPMYVGVLLGFWMSPNMSVGHALLALAFTAYIAVAMFFERRDLQAKHGRSYADWRHGRQGCPLRSRSAKALLSEKGRRNLRVRVRPAGRRWPDTQFGVSRTTYPWTDCASPER